MKENELKNCDFVKTVLMIFVVLGHSMIFWRGNWFSIQHPVYTSQLLVVVTNWINSFHIYGFTLVSGYIFYFLKVEKEAYNDFKVFIFKKVKRLLIPYVFIATVWVIPISCYFFKYDLTTIVKIYVLATAPSQLWFVVMLFGVFVIFGFSSDFFKRHDWLGLMIVGGLYFVGVVGSHIVMNVFQIWTIFRYLLFFWIGFKIRQHGSDMFRKMPGLLWIAIDLVIFCVTEYLNMLNGIEFKILSKMGELVLFVVGSVMAFVVLQEVAGILKWQESKMFNILKELSMPIYLVHQQIIYYLITWTNGNFSAITNAALIFLSALVCSILLSWILMKFKITRFLIGEKV